MAWNYNPPTVWGNNQNLMYPTGQNALNRWSNANSLTTLQSPYNINWDLQPSTNWGSIGNNTTLFSPTNSRFTFDWNANSNVNSGVNNQVKTGNTVNTLNTNTGSTNQFQYQAPNLQTSNVQPSTGAINYYDPATAMGFQITRGNNSFDLSPYQQQSSGFLGLGSKTNFDYFGAEKAWLATQTPEFQNAYLNGMTPEMRQAYWQNGVGKGAVNLDQFANLNQMQNTATRLMNEQTNSKWTTQDTMGVIQGGIQGLNSLANLYMGYKQYKLAKKNMEETLALQRANYRMNARQLNNYYRDQMSGRAGSVQSGQANRKLGKMYANRKVAEDY